MDTKNGIEPLFEKIENYSKSSIELLKLKSISKMSCILSNMIFYTIAFFMFGVFVVFMSISVALWLGTLLENNYNGFLCVSGFYALIFLTLILGFKKIIVTKVSNYLIAILLKLKA